MTDEQSRPAEILLVEDNADDVLLTRESFKRSHLLVNLHHVENGKECMDFLHKRGEYADAPTPDLILLDLKMPVMDGREVLAEMVEDEKLRHLVVVVLTTSAGDEDVLEMYRLRCSSYITKPVDFEKFHEVLMDLWNYWFRLVVLPRSEQLPGSTGSD